MLMQSKTAVLVTAISAMFVTPGFAAEHEVKMLNRGEDGEMMVFEPAFLKVEPGDTVTFVPTDKSHNAESILGAIPEGAEAFKGRINEEISVTFDAEGVHAYKCTPHFALGMVGLIQVGDSTDNLADIQSVRLPGRAAAKMALLVEQVGSSAGESADAGESDTPTAEEADASAGN